MLAAIATNIRTECCRMVLVQWTNKYLFWSVWPCTTKRDFYIGLVVYTLLIPKTNLPQKTFASYSISSLRTILNVPFFHHSANLFRFGPIKGGIVTIYYRDALFWSRIGQVLPPVPKYLNLSISLAILLSETSAGSGKSCVKPNFLVVRPSVIHICCPWIFIILKGPSHPRIVYLQTRKDFLGE